MPVNGGESGSVSLMPSAIQQLVRRLQHAPRANSGWLAKLLLAIPHLPRIGA
jgi:hypothetical protein